MHQVHCGGQNPKRIYVLYCLYISIGEVASEKEKSFQFSPSFLPPESWSKVHQSPTDSVEAYPHLWQAETCVASFKLPSLPPAIQVVEAPNTQHSVNYQRMKQWVQRAFCNAQFCNCGVCILQCSILQLWSAFCNVQCSLSLRGRFACDLHRSIEFYDL